MSLQETREIALSQIFNLPENFSVDFIRKFEKENNKTKILLQALSKSILDPYRHEYGVLDWTIEKTKNQDLKKDDFNEIKPGTIINKQTSAKTQIKSVIQEKAEDIDRNPKILEKKQEVEKLEIINSFEKLVQITNDKKEIELKFDLERNVRVVKFETGKIDISFNEKLSKNFVRSLTEKLKLWTGKRWIISLSKETGKNTIFENKEVHKKKLLQDALESEVYKKIKESFPDAELSEVEETK